MYRSQKLVDKSRKYQPNREAMQHSHLSTFLLRPSIIVFRSLKNTFYDQRYVSLTVGINLGQIAVRRTPGRTGQMAGLLGPASFCPTQSHDSGTVLLTESWQNCEPRRIV